MTIPAKTVFVAYEVETRTAVKPRLQFTLYMRRDTAVELKPMKQIAIYVRVSSKPQDTASQEPDIERWISAYGNGSPVEWYRDKFTGKTMDRPGMAHS